MFNKNEFAKIIKNIKDTYISQEEFANKSGIGRTYLSQYMNMKLDIPPKPRILKKLADASNGITTYKELMLICNYIDDELDEIFGDSISLISNPYTSSANYNPSEQFLLSIIHTYNNLSIYEKSQAEKDKVIKAYEYIKNDIEYSKLIAKYDKLKKTQTDTDDIEIRAIARDVAKLKPEKKELFKNLLRQMSDEADEASKR